MVDDQIVKEAKHPMHGEVSTVEIECLKIIKKMKVDAATDLNVDLKVIYDRSIKLLTEKNILALEALSTNVVKRRNQIYLKQLMMLRSQTTID